MSAISSSVSTSRPFRLYNSYSNSSSSEVAQTPDENHGESTPLVRSVEGCSATTSKYVLESDCLGNILSFLCKKDAISLRRTSNNQKNAVDFHLNETFLPKTLPESPIILFFDIQEVAQKLPSTKRLARQVNDKLQWDAWFVIHCLEKTKTILTSKNSLQDLVNSMFAIHKCYLVSCAAQLGDMTLLNLLKQHELINAEDARGENNFALREATKNGHVEVVEFFKDKFRLTLS